MSDQDSNGHWVTIKGTHVFIHEGETYQDAFARQKAEAAEAAARSAAKLPAPYSVYPEGSVAELDLTDNQIDALIWYQSSGGYKTINRQLRQNLPLSKNAKEAVERIDSSFAPLQSDLVVYKGISYTKQHDDLFRKTLPETVSDEAYWSTSVSEWMARNFTHNNTILRIHLPKGFPVIPLDAVIWNNPNFLKNQKELLLPRGLTFRVISRIDENHYTYIDLVPKEDKDDSME